VIYLYKNRILNNRNNMKNKNLLAENMLRFRSKNLSETTKRKIIKLAEIISEQGVVDPSDAQFGKKMTWDFGYRPGDVITSKNIAPGAPQDMQSNFKLVSSNLLSKQTLDDKTIVSGQVVLQQTKTGKQSQILIDGGKGATSLRYTGNDELLKQAISIFNSNGLSDSEFLTKLKAAYLNRVS
jgi:hypothetical protein